MTTLITFIQRAIMQGIPLLYGSTGEILTEKSGNLNLGIPGIMYVGGISGVIGAFLYEESMGANDLNPFLAVLIPLLCTIIGSLLTGLIYCFLTVTLRANQNVTGLAITTFGVGFGNFFGSSLVKLQEVIFRLLPLQEQVHFSLKTSYRFNYRLVWKNIPRLWFLTYAAIVIALLVAFFLKKTRGGLHLRAVGENPATADAAGIDVSKSKYLATSIGSVIAGIGGLFYVMDYANGVWSNEGFGDRGWLAIALVIFAIWKPDFGILGSILFGGLYIVYLFIPGLKMSTQELFKMLPYIVTIIVLVIVSVRKKREDQPPASLGLSYFREDR